jgi:HTH-type transcriptional regulator/antitoxin HigA
MMNPKPARILPPGATVKHLLEELDLTQREFAQMIERPEVFVSELIKGKRQITIDTARRLAASLGGSPETWLRMEQTYRLRIEQEDRELIGRIRARRPALAG